MSWLARIEVDAETLHSEGISNDIYSWHQSLWKCFPGKPESERNFLTRIDPLDVAFRLWVMSKCKPERPPWCPTNGFALNEIAQSFFSHRYYSFDLRANPTRCQVKRGPNGETLYGENGKRKHGKRVPLVKQDDLRKWLNKKAEARCNNKETGLDIPGGFRILEENPLEISPMVESHFRKNGSMAYHGGVRFRGMLEVIDQDKFIDSYHYGIGGAKAFGFGLLLLAPITY